MPRFSQLSHLQMVGQPSKMDVLRAPILPNLCRGLVREHIEADGKYYVPF